MAAGKKIIWIMVVLAAGGGLLLSLFFRGAKQTDTRAASGSTVITSQAQWEAGESSTFLDTVSSPGDVKINVGGGFTIIEVGDAVLTASINEGSAELVIDGNDATGWGFESSYEGECHWWKMDLGGVVEDIAKIRCVGGGDADSSQEVLFSSDDSSYTSINKFHGGEGYVSEFLIVPPTETRYVRVVVCNEYYHNPPDWAGISELTLYTSPNSATHTSSPTQITHNDLYEWETFTPNYTKPENTNIEFRFRTSKDSESWTDWTSYQTPSSGSPLDISSLVTSREGEPGEEDFYRYFQVETRLTSTDGVSTPTLSDYTIGYHTNVAPAKPTAQTAVIGQ